jgi:probable phosphoglycerate mutase
MKVIFVRHGQTNYNLQSLCNDDPTVNVYLTELGQQQAQIVAAQLKTVPIERIIVSELPRTYQTAIIINQYHGVKIEVRSALNDIRSGFEGQAVHKYFAAIAHDVLNAKANNGESFMDYKRRVETFLTWLKQQTETVILVVAHEETMRIFKGYFHQIADENLRQMRFENCAVLEVEF